MSYSNDILGKYENQIKSKLNNIDTAINKNHKIIAPGIVQYDFETFDELFRNVNPLIKPLCLNEYIFRGHSHSNYKLLPTVKRGENSFRKEFDLLTQFAEKIARRNLFMPSGGQMFLNPCKFLDSLDEWIPLEALDFVAYARHAGLATRMLDWTYDFWTAVYFASSGILDEIREIIKLDEQKKSESNIVFNDQMVIWLFNIKQWRELTDYKAPLHPYGLFKSNLHFTTPYYHNNANARAQKGLLSYFTLEIDKNTGNSPIDVLNAWDCASLNEKDNYSLDEYIAQGYSTIIEKEVTPNIPIMFKFTIPMKAALEIIDSLIKLGYTSSSVYPSVENCVKDIQENDDYSKLEEIFNR